MVARCKHIKNVRMLEEIKAYTTHILDEGGVVNHINEYGDYCGHVMFECNECGFVKFYPWHKLPKFVERLREQMVATSDGCYLGTSETPTQRKHRLREQAEQRILELQENLLMKKMQARVDADSLQGDVVPGDN